MNWYKQSQRAWKASEWPLMVSRVLELSPHESGPFIVVRYLAASGEIVIRSLDERFTIRARVNEQSHSATVMVTERTPEGTNFVGSEDFSWNPVNYKEMPYSMILTAYRLIDQGKKTDKQVF